jgi:hypothetical protein
LVGISEGNKPLEDVDIDKSLILKWIVRKYNWSLWTGFIWHKIGTNGGLL